MAGPQQQLCSAAEKRTYLWHILKMEGRGRSEDLLFREPSFGLEIPCKLIAMLSRCWVISKYPLPVQKLTISSFFHIVSNTKYNQDHSVTFEWEIETMMFQNKKLISGLLIVALALVSNVKGSGITSSCGYDVNFAEGDHGWVQVASEVFEAPDFEVMPEGLAISPGGSSSCFGYWKSPPLSVIPEYKLEFRFELSTDASLGEAPAIRLRVNEANLNYSTMIVLESNNADGPGVSEEREVYTLDYRAPQGATALEVAVDLLSFNEEDDLDAGIILHSIEIECVETVPLPVKSIEEENHGDPLNSQ